MAAVTLTVDDLIPFAPDIEPGKATAMIDDALALAAVVAPCILEDTFTAAGAAKAILRGAVLRWHDAGAGAIVSQSAGPFAPIPPLVFPPAPRWGTTPPRGPSGQPSA